MFAAKIISMLSATVLAIDFQKAQEVGDDASLHCLDNNAFCQRTREWKIDQADPTSPHDISYIGSAPAMVNEDGRTYVDSQLSLSCDQSGYLAPNLTARVEFY